jgi:fructose-bisphosphate aldolase, class II
VPIVPFKEIMKDAFTKKYGVGAFNIFNDLTMEAVLQAAESAKSPVIVQTSVKTVKSIGIDVLYSIWIEMTRKITVPVCLHLDHCPERAMISSCLAKGWGSVLFDASELPYEENRRQTIEVVAEAKRYGAGVEGEIESIKGVEDGVGTETESRRKPLETALEFIQATKIDCFAPSIGNAHGVKKVAPQLDAQRVTDIVSAHPLPIALHGGTGLTNEQFKDLINRGCSKVNVSTALKVNYMQSNLAFLRDAEIKDKWDPPTLFKHVNQSVRELVTGYIQMFGSVGHA